LEGLPIHQYKEAEITIGNNPTETKQLHKDDWPELPMPKDSHLLPLHSQQLLKAARRARTIKPLAPPEEDIENRDEEDEHKEVPQGFTVKKWIKVARHLEESEPEYLAKRRKGLPSQYASGHASTQLPPMRETKVKKTDAEGNVIVYKALVPEGQAVEGEIQENDAVVETAPVAAAPGTIVEGVGVVNAEGVVVANDIIMQQTPQRRRAPPPKKRRGGPGRRKKVVFVEGAAEQGASTPGMGSDRLAVPGTKHEGSAEPSEGGDTPMRDAGDDEEGSGEDGSDDEENETTARSRSASEAKPSIPVKENTSMKETPPVAERPKTPAESVKSTVPTPLTAKPTHDPSSSPELPLSSISHSRQNSTNQVPTMTTLEANVPDSASADALPARSPGLISGEATSPEDGETDLLGSLERQLDKDSESMAAP
jgi:hypothetical protein